MNDIVGWIMAGVAGMALGAFFFGGLWWTVRSSFSSPRPGLLVFVSLLLRLGIALAGFFLVADGHWQPLIACLLGFIVARVIIVRLPAPRHERHPRRQHATEPEITHAP